MPKVVSKNQKKLKFFQKYSKVPQKKFWASQNHHRLLKSQILKKYAFFDEFLAFSPYLPPPTLRSTTNALCAPLHHFALAAQNGPISSPPKVGKNGLTAGLTQSFLDQRRSEPKKRLAHKSLFSKNKWLSKKFSRRKKFCSKKFFFQSLSARGAGTERKPKAGVEWRRPAPTNFGKKNFFERNFFFWKTFLTMI